MSRPVVVDASALAALLFAEPDGRAMAERMEGRALFAPPLLSFELASVCLKKCREAPEMAPALRRALGLATRLGIQEVRVPPAPLIDLAGATGLTAYDAAYLWLTRELDGDLVTLDARLERAAGP
ncbi:MAG: type II toxin-antitoxin system VapC family toxin [Longimicrobiales bacterium]|nr:type II toxin-antitoxin system VapC family toxin [Longimicrobiales bacterium]